MPISCVLKCVDDVVLNPDFKSFSFERLTWMPKKLNIFTEKLKERNTVKDLDAAKQAIPVNTNQAVSMFTAVMKRVSECMNKKVKVTKQYPRRTWLVKECQQATTEVKRTLRNFRSNLMKDRTRYVELRKQYRSSLRRKSDCYKN